MNFDTTYKNLKKRIFDILDEYSSSSDTVFVSDGDRQHIESRIPDTVNSCLVRMYKSLPIAIDKAIQKINSFTPILYDREIPDGDRNLIEFSSPTANLAIFFRYFGSGRVTFYNSTGAVLGTADCSDTSTLTTKRGYISLASSSVYRVGISGSVKIMDFCIYANDGRTNVSALCGVNEASFELPENCDEIISVEGRYGKADHERICTEGGYAFIPKSEIGKAEAVTVEYRKVPQVITETTADSFVFDLSPLAFEALVCLCASEVCREQDAAKHTRLVYKYNDLCEGLRESFSDRKKRNTFFKARLGKRW
ncbi:MAG: hypothetical protein IJZ20_07465 [Clostridia bacterium]|nr:hypothetical protein [Clostridia bacterium]MBQ8759515.1 hypothetical protein [Clostridia bacterium]